MLELPHLLFFSNRMALIIRFNDSLVETMACAVNWLIGNIIVCGVTEKMIHETCTPTPSFLMLLFKSLRPLQYSIQLKMSHLVDVP